MTSKNSLTIMQRLFNLEILTMLMLFRRFRRYATQIYYLFVKSEDLSIFFRIFVFKSFSHHTLFHIIFLTYKFFTLEIKMGKEKHNFREFFYLCTPDNPKSNKKAVCFSCIRKYTLPLAISKPECFVPNKALL